MELDHSPLYLQFYNSMLRLKRAGNRVPPPCKELSHFEFMCLNVIADYSREHPELPGIKASLLSELTRISRPAISQHINILEEKGFISRSTSKTDRRVTYLCLTESASVFLTERQTEFLQHLQLVCDLLGHDDTVKLIELTEKLSRIFISISEQSDGTKPL